MMTSIQEFAIDDGMVRLSATMSTEVPVRGDLDHNVDAAVTLTALAEAYKAIAINQGGGHVEQ